MTIARLHKRPENGIFYYRVSVPKDLISIVGKREIKVSLKTTNLHHAKRAMFDAAHAIESYFSQSRGETARPDFCKPSVITRPMKDTITLDNLVERYFKAQEHQRLADKTRAEYVLRFGVIMTILGATRPISDISREDCRNLQQTVMKLPPNMSKRFPGKRPIDSKQRLFNLLLIKATRTKRSSERGKIVVSPPAGKQLATVIVGLLRFAQYRSN